MTDLMAVVVRILGAALLLALVLCGVLALLQRPLPDVLVGTVTLVLGLLGGILAPRPDLIVSPRPKHAAED